LTSIQFFNEISSFKIGYKVPYCLTEIYFEMNKICYILILKYYKTAVIKDN